MSFRYILRRNKAAFNEVRHLIDGCLNQIIKTKCFDSETSQFEVLCADLNNIDISHSHGKINITNLSFKMINFFGIIDTLRKNDDKWNTN